MIKRRRFSEDIADSILDRVVEMGLKPGDRLPTHSQLSGMLGVSLPSLREGLSLLSLSGVINITHGAGTTLATPVPDDYFKMLKPVSRINSTNMDDLSEFCSVFIPDLADAALRKNHSSIDFVSSMIQCSIPDDKNRFMKFHKEFHSFLASSLENPLKSSAFLIALNLFYTHSELLSVSTQTLQLYLKAHMNLLASLLSEIKEDVETALSECYNFRFSVEDNIARFNKTFGTGSLGGSFHSMAKRFTTLMEGEDSINIHLELSGGGIDNVDLIEEGKTILALTQSDIAEAAYFGKGIFEKPHNTLRVICSVRPLDLWIVASSNSGIAGLGDLKGRRIAMGAEGGDSGIIARSIFHRLGFEPGDYRPFYLSLSNALQGLRNNEIDLVFFLAHEMPNAVKDLSETVELKFIPIPSEIAEFLEEKNSFWKGSEYTVFNGSEKTINTISVGTVLVTSSLVSDSLICRIATVLKNSSDPFDQVSFSIFSDPASVPLHPGVVECLK